MTIEEYYAEMAPKLTNYLIAKGAPYSIACDIVQESFLRLWKRWNTVEDNAAMVAGLLYKIAHNLHIDYVRSGKFIAFEEEIPDTETTESAPEQRPAEDLAYLRRRINAAMKQLPPLLREAYSLFQIGEFSVREIARQTNASEALVKVRIHRAKQQLQELLADLQGQ